MRAPGSIMPVVWLVLGLQGCGIIQPQAIYEEIRTQERALAVGQSAVPRTDLPRYDQYEKARQQLAPPAN